MTRSYNHSLGPITPRPAKAANQFRRGLIASALLSGLLANPLAGNPAYERVALVIGNSDYVGLPDLPNAINDAAVISDMLASAGYLVFEETDLTKQEFSASIAEISANLNASSEVVFFFAGHGFQIGSENYLLPTNSDISDLSDVPLQSISLTHVLEHFSTQSGSQVVLLDSCRSNPFAGEQAYAGLEGETLRIENGFSFQSAPVNSLISFSTAPGAVALDGEGENSPYTASLIDATQRFPDYDVASVLPIVRAQVFDETDGFQVPWESSSLLRPVFLSSRDRDETSLKIVTAPAPETPAAPVIARDRSAEGPLLITSEAIIHRHLPVFSAEDIKKVGGAGPFTVEALPEGGTLGVRSGDRIRLVEHGEQLGLTAVTRLTYSPDLPVVKASLAAESLTDKLRLRTSTGVAEVTLQLSYHACDLAAASPLDPDGIGLSVENFEMIPDRAVAVCTEAVASYPSESRFHYQLSRAQIAKRDYDAAEASARAALELGHTRAHVGLGQITRNRLTGIGANAETAVPEEVRRHYLDGHKAGDPMATYLLGRQMMRFGNTAESRQSGFALLHRSKDAGYVEALNELARYFLLSEDGNANPQRGLQYLEESGARGNSFGFNSLGIVYKNGVGGIPQDFERAVENFKAAANLGHPTAPTSLGRVFAEGQLVTPDFPRARRWYEEGLARADPWGGVNAATLILLDKMPGAGMSDAVILSAKAAALKTESARRAALDQLESRSRDELARGLQSFLLEQGQAVTVDGQPGPQTAQAIVEVYGALVPLDSKSDLIAALVKVAEAYWRQSDVRADLN